MIQAAQANAHKVFAQLFSNTGPVKAPWQLKTAVRIPGITQLIGRAVGIGIRPEHIKDARRSPAYRNGRVAKIALGLGMAAGFVIAYRKLCRAR